MRKRGVRAVNQWKVLSTKILGSWFCFIQNTLRCRHVFLAATSYSPPNLYADKFLEILFQTRRWRVLGLTVFCYVPLSSESPYHIIFYSVAKTPGAIHSIKIPTGPTGKSGPPQKVDPFFRNFSSWTVPIHWVLDRNFRKFSLNGSRPPSIRPSSDVVLLPFRT